MSIPPAFFLSKYGSDLAVPQIVMPQNVFAETVTCLLYVL